jgi:hypothetical protein
MGSRKMAVLHPIECAQLAVWFSAVERAMRGLWTDPGRPGCGRTCDQDQAAADREDDTCRRRVHHQRCRHGHCRCDGDLPRRTDRADQPQGQRDLRAPLRGLPDATTLHPRHDRQEAQGPSPSRPAPPRPSSATDPDWQDRYRQHRPMVERTIAWLVARGHRRVRFGGIAAIQFWLSHRAAAVNPKRLITLGLGLAHNNTGWPLTLA